MTSLVIGNNGVLYGALVSPNGTIYSLTPPASGRGWTYTGITTFNGGIAGSEVYPNDLAIDSNGILYGTNQYGGGTNRACGASGCGLVYSLAPPATPGGAWTKTILYSFIGGADGKNPAARVTLGLGPAGRPNLFGTTYHNGSGGYGTVFSLTPPAAPGGTWTEATLYSFTGGADGANPAGALAIDGNVVLYGTTPLGGASNRGVVFSLTPASAGAWTEAVLYSFSGGATGAVPSGGVLLGAGGELYGTTSTGGTGIGGVVYEVAPPVNPGGSWTETVLHTFTHKSGSGVSPGPLVWGSNGVLYGATYAGGPSRRDLSSR